MRVAGVVCDPSPYAVTDTLLLIADAGRFSLPPDNIINTGTIRMQDISDRCPERDPHIGSWEDWDSDNTGHVNSRILAAWAVRWQRG